jgi:hypothetical protein
MKRITCLFVLIALIVSCKKPYNPPAITSPGSYLVVEGVINSGSDSTIIKLSKTVKLSSGTTVNPVTDAEVAVESDQSIIYPLTGTTNGNYVTAGLNLNNSHKYRLTIKAANNEQYYSNYEAVLNSPAIDSVYFTINSNGIDIYSATHDVTSTVKYFRWDYQETWIIHSNFESFFISNGDTVLGRTANQEIYTCWHSDTSSNIIVGSSAKLSRDVIYNNPIISIASASEKLGTEYSILVRQYALTSDAYDFYTNLKTNTEQLGSIFDAQPSQINGNIYSATNPNEPVIGYISVGNVSSLRIFIRNQQLPNWVTTPFYTDCTLAFDQPNNPKTPCCYYNFEGINQVNAYINYNIGGDPDPLIPINSIAMPGHPPIGYTATSKKCADCSLRGTTIQPSFWQ